MEVAEHNLESSETGGFHVYIASQFQTTYAEKGGGVESVVEMTVNSKEENSNDFCPINVQEFGLRLYS